MFKSLNTSNRNNSKDFIVKIVFKLLLENNFEKVTVPLIEKTGNLNRGGIFYHFSNKEEIFQAVIDVYFFSWLNVFYPVPLDKNSKDLQSYIETRKHSVNEIKKWFQKEHLSVNPINGFLHLGGQADRYYQNFGERFNELIEEDIKNWEKAIKQNQQLKSSSQNLEVRKIAELFRHSFLGELLDFAYCTSKLNIRYQSVKTLLKTLDV